MVPGETVHAPNMPHACMCPTSTPSLKSRTLTARRLASTQREKSKGKDYCSLPVPTPRCPLPGSKAGRSTWLCSRVRSLHL